MSEIENEDSESKQTGEIEIGTFNLHLSSLKKGMDEFKIWRSITIGVISMAMPNSYNRIDLRDKDTLKRLEKETGLKIDYDYLEHEIAKKPWLVQPNGFRAKSDPTMDGSGRKVTKKQLKINLRKEKMQVKIDKLKAKHKAIKNKKCDRALKLTGMINELETKRDRM